METIVLIATWLLIMADATMLKDTIEPSDITSRILLMLGGVCAIMLFMIMILWGIGK